MYKVKFLYGWRETNIFQVYYSICKGLNYFFPSMTLEKIYQMTREKLFIATFKKWPFANDFRIETEDGKVLSALCRYCCKMEYNDFMQEARSRRSSSALKSIVFSRKCYIHLSKYICPSCRNFNFFSQMV